MRPQAEAEILSTYAIPAPFSADLAAAPVAVAPPVAAMATGLPAKGRGKAAAAAAVTPSTVVGPAADGTAHGGDAAEHGDARSKRGISKGAAAKPEAKRRKKPS